MVLTYTPEGRPTQILKDLLLSYWDTRSNNEIPLPTILEVPLPNFQRVDVRNQGDTILISLEGFEEQLIHIGFKNRQITASMLLQFQVFTSRQRLYDMVQEARRIIFSKQYNPTDYLLNDFEGYSNTAAMLVDWTAATNTTATLNTSVSQFGTKSLRLVASGGTGGHIFPAQSLAAELKTRGYQLILLTDKRGYRFGGNLSDIEKYRIRSGSPLVPGLLGKSLGMIRLLITKIITQNSQKLVFTQQKK